MRTAVARTTVSARRADPSGRRRAPPRRAQGRVRADGGRARRAFDGPRHEREADAIADRIIAAAGVDLLPEAGAQDESASPPAGRLPEAPAPVREVVAEPGAPLDLPTRRFMEARFGRDFRGVRIHAGDAAAASARAVDARAYTLGEHVVFDRGGYRPHVDAGRRLLAHELTHVAQQGFAPAVAGPGTHGPRVTASAPGVQRSDGAPAAAPTPPVRRFADLYEAFQEHRLGGRDSEAAALVPDLVAHMGFDEARSHAVELAFWLMDRGDWTQARAVLRTLEHAWWLQYVTSGIPVTIAALPATPRRLYERARTEALADRHAQAAHLLGMAYLFVQFLLHDAAQQREAQLEKSSEQLAALGESARELVPGVTTVSRIIAYSTLGGIFDLLRDIVGLYPRLEREAIAAGDQERARRYSGLGLLVRMELHERYTLSQARAITMETAATSTPFGQAGYEITGRDLTTTETVTPLPGTRTPAELGLFPPYGATMEALLESVAGQEEYLTELFAYPEIRREFGGALPDLNRLNDRLRVWRTMYRVYERENLLPLAALMSLIRSYLERFTFHSEYNIRDYGVNYLTSDFPVDLAGRAVRDCGVYALTTAYEVHQTARAASVRLNLDFRLYVMPEHVILVIADRDADSFYVVNNDRIEGPQRGEEISAVARAYGQVFGRRFGVAPGVAVALGSTAESDAAFRSQVWQRYRVGVATGLRLERPPGAGPDVTEAEAAHHTYQRYYEDLARFDVGARRLAAELDRLRADAAGSNAQTERALLAARLPELTALAQALTLIFARRGPQADIIVDERLARAALGRGFARRLPGIVGERHIFVFTEASNHPLARLAMALLRHAHLGGTLSADAQALLQALRLIREFDADLSAYDRAGRPAAF